MPTFRSGIASSQYVDFSALVGHCDRGEIA